MMTDESLIEWASGWVPDEPPGQRARFVEGLRDELQQRADALMFVRAQRDVAEETKKLSPGHIGYVPDPNDPTL